MTRKGFEESGSFFVPLGVGLSGIDAEHPENRLFFVSAITSRVDTNSRKFAAFAPTFDGKGGNTENRGYFGNGQKVREIV